MVFLAPYFHHLSLTSLAGLRLWLSVARVQDLRVLSLVSQRLSSWSYSFHSLLCTSLLFDYDWNSFCLQPVFCWWHTATLVTSSWSDARQCLDHANMHLWHEDLDNTKQTDNEWRQDSVCPREVNRTIFFLRSAHFSSCWHCRHSDHDLCSQIWFHDFR